MISTESGDLDMKLTVMWNCLGHKTALAKNIERTYMEICTDGKIQIDAQFNTIIMEFVWNYKVLKVLYMREDKVQDEEGQFTRGKVPDWILLGDNSHPHTDPTRRLCYSQYIRSTVPSPFLAAHAAQSPSSRPKWFIHLLGLHVLLCWPSGLHSLPIWYTIWY